MSGIIIQENTVTLHCGLGKWSNCEPDTFNNVDLCLFLSPCVCLFLRLSFLCPSVSLRLCLPVSVSVSTYTTKHTHNPVCCLFRVPGRRRVVTRLVFVRVTDISYVSVGFLEAWNATGASGEGTSRAVFPQGENWVHTSLGFIWIY